VGSLDLTPLTLRQDNFVHADLHPGNILYSADPMALALVDAGMVTRPSQEERLNVLGLLEALGEGLGGEAARCLLRCSPTTHSVMQQRAFRADMDTLFRSVCKGYHSNVSVAEVLTGMLRVSEPSSNLSH